MAAVQADDEAWPEDAVEVGRIVEAWGLQGGIKVLPFSSDPQALFSSRRWFLKPPLPKTASQVAAAAQRVPAIPATLCIASARAQGDVIVARPRDFDDRSQAEALRGCRVFVSRASFPTLEEGEFYWLDLIGMAVVNREGQSLGTVAGLLDTGAHSVLRVAQENEPSVERLIPFVDAYIDGVDAAGRCIRVDWGLDY